LYGALQTFSVLLCKDGLLIQLIIDCVGKEVTAGGEIGGALNGAITNNCVLGWRGRRQSQASSGNRHRAGAI
jgi:hypothetical protein